MSTTKTRPKKISKPTTTDYTNPLSKSEFTDLLDEANQVYRANHDDTAVFERAIFFGWYCEINDCKFCYMSKRPKDKTGKLALRTTASVLAETIITKELDWQLGFFTGGINAKNPEQFIELLSAVKAAAGQKIWISIGPVPKQQLERYTPYIDGVVGSIETVNPTLHDFVCPSKPIKPYVKMFESANELGLNKAMTLILGIGETLDDFARLTKFIKENNIDKIHIYNLIPHEGTYFANATPPSVEYQAVWIAKTRIAFPKLDIQAGIWEDKTKDMHLLLKAGSNSISKFPALKRFASPAAKEFESEVKLAGRKMRGSLTRMPQRDWNKIVSELPFDEKMKTDVGRKLSMYLKGMKKQKK